MSNHKKENLDTLLDSLLHKLPDKPVASNFTFRVLQTVAHEKPSTACRPNLWGEIFRHPMQFIPRILVGCLAFGLGVFGFQRYELATQANMASSVAAVAQVSSLPSPDILQDFEAVRHLSQTPPADQELLALLQ